MKFFLLLAALSLPAFAQDMSRTENWETSYREESDGSTTYIGGCSTHQDYEGKHFQVGKTIISYFEPYGLTNQEIGQQLSKADRALLKVLEKRVGGDLSGVDDLTLEKISSKRFPKLDLYRFNVGVGGGNGIYFVFHKTTAGSYELMSEIMDGDVEYCDKKVWLR